MSGPLAGVRVLEQGSRVACGIAGSLLAAIGAEVIVVEPAQGVEPLRKHAHRVPLTAGKRSVVLAPACDDDAATLAALAAGCDVVLASSDVDGVTRGDLPARVVACDVTAFGATGPRAGENATDLELQALAGLVDTTGLPDAAPIAIAGLPIEVLGGLHAAIGVLAALLARDRDGLGQWIEIALFDCAFAALTTYVSQLLEGPDAEVARDGNRHPLIAPWNVYRSTDGWLLICAGSDDLFRRLAHAIGRGDLAEDPRFASNADRVANVAMLDAAIGRWIAARDLDESLTVLLAAGVPCGPIAPVDPVPREPNLVHRGAALAARDPETGAEVFVPASPIRAGVATSRCAPAIPARDADREAVHAKRAVGAAPCETERPDPSPPLAGIRVIEIGHYTTAPLAARYLASLGADVTKVEPPGGEVTRRWRSQRHGVSLFFALTNAGKHLASLDLDGPEGRAALERLLAGADVLVENLKPGALERRGFPPERLATIGPGLVYCAVSGFGRDSLYAGRPAYDSVIQAMSGMMDLNRAEGVPVKTGISAADLVGALTSVVAILAALVARRRGGAGADIDLSMQDAAAWSTQLAWNAPGAARPPAVERRGDRWWIVDPDGDPAGVPVRTAREMLDDPHTRARGLAAEVTNAAGRTWPVIANPVLLTRTPLVVAPFEG